MEAINNTTGNALKTNTLVVFLMMLISTLSVNAFSIDNDVIEKKPIAKEHTAYYLEVADTLLVYNNFDDCLWALSRAAKCDPTSKDVFHKRAMVYMQMGYFKKAIKDFEHSILLGESTADIYNHIGIANYLNENIEAAEKAYNKAIEIEPLYAKAYYNRGILWLSENEMEMATVDFLKAMELNSALELKDNNPETMACLK